VGGAAGNLLTAILGRHCGPRGILFDLPHVVRDAPALTEGRGLMARISVEAANFFENVRAAGEAYVLSRIIHDWGEVSFEAGDVPRRSSISIENLKEGRRHLRPGKALHRLSHRERLAMRRAVPPEMWFHCFGSSAAP
jgi:hypothetical protein